MENGQQNGNFLPGEPAAEQYADLTGSEFLTAEDTAEPGTVELSIPPKGGYSPVAGVGKKEAAEPEKTVVKPVLPEVVFEEPEVDDDGVALTIPPQKLSPHNAELDVKPMYVKPAGVGIDVLNNNFGEDNGDDGIDASEVGITDYEDFSPAAGQSVEAGYSRSPVGDDVSGAAASDEIKSEFVVDEKMVEVSHQAETSGGNDELPSFLHEWSDNGEDADELLGKLLDENDTGDDVSVVEDLIKDEKLNEAEVAASSAGNGEKNVFSENFAATEQNPMRAEDVFVDKAADEREVQTGVFQGGMEEISPYVQENLPEQQVEKEDAYPAGGNVQSLDNNEKFFSEETTKLSEKWEPVARPEEQNFPDVAGTENNLMNQTVAAEKSEEALQENAKSEDVYHFNRKSGVQRFVSQGRNGVIVLDNLDYEKHELSSWNLLFLDSCWKEISQGADKVNIPMGQAAFRIAEIVQAGGYSLRLYNVENFEFETLSGIQTYPAGKIVSGTDSDKAVILNDVFIQPLQNLGGKELKFDTPRSGMLTGPDGALLCFAEVVKIVIPAAESVQQSYDDMQRRIAKRYAGNLSDVYASYSAENLEGEFIADAEKKFIRLDVGKSTYGWSIRFDNGLTLTLADVREYQLRNGRLPKREGIIVYGNKQLRFQGCERIVFYQEAEYFSYK